MKILIVILLTLSNLFGGFADGFARGQSMAAQGQMNKLIAERAYEKEKQRINEYYKSQMRLYSIKYEMILEDIIEKKNNK